MARRDFFKKTQQTRYRSRSYRNPHLKEKRRINWRVVLLVTAVSLVFGIGIWFLLSFARFRITRVEIRGTEYINRQDLESTISSYLHERTYFFFDRTNRFLFSSEMLTEKILDQFALTSAVIGLQDDTLFLTVEERTSNLLWRTQNKIYVVDLEGVIVRQIFDDEDPILQQDPLSLLPLFIDKNNIAVETGSQVLKAGEVEGALTFFSDLQTAGIAYTYTDIDRLAGKWMRVVTEDGYGILFDVAGDIDEQYKRLVIVLSEQVESVAKLEYIDLRFGDKVYFK